MAETMKAVCVSGDAPLSLGDVLRPDPAPGEVLIKVAASGLNRADLLQRRGMYPPPPGASDIMGLECAGEIAALGEGVSGWSVGDRVCALLAGGGYAEYTAVDAGSLLPIPEGLSFTHAACLPEAMMTVWANVYDRCAFQPGEAFLVHGGTSGIGVMAIQMARVWGASEIFTTAGSDEKCATATDLGATRAINYKTEDFEAVVSGAGGVDVTLDMVGADYIQKNISIARVNGRIVNIAYMNGPKVELNLMPLMLKRLILTGTTLRARPVEEKARIRAAVEKDFWPAVATGDIKPILDTAFPAAEADAAQALMAKGGHVGKIILEW
ncbi:MAG: NAD(P)H-quinone oxidoreductase [Pseudomonadota bacterium]